MASSRLSDSSLWPMIIHATYYDKYVSPALYNFFLCEIWFVHRRGSGNNNCDNNATTTTDKDVDNFLVCVFNVSSKVSYSILQVNMS